MVVFNEEVMKLKKRKYVPFVLVALLLGGCKEVSEVKPALTTSPDISVQETKPIPFERIEKEIENPRIEVFANEKAIFYSVPARIDQYMEQRAAMVSLYPTAKAMGWEVTEDNGWYIIQDKGETVRFKLNQRVFLHNEESKRTEVPFRLLEEEVFIPVRAIALALGDEVEWNEKKFHLKLTTPPILPVSIPILVYHDVQYNRYDTLAVDPIRFQEQMSLLKEQGYTTITERDLSLYLQQEKALPDKPIMIHFDDGYENTYTHAYPILKELNMKATYYLVGNTVKEKTEDEEIYANKHLSWEQIREMHESGVISFESHTYNLHTNGVSAKFAAESEEAYEYRLYEDFVLSKNVIEEKLGTSVLSLAYPFGDYNETADNVAKKAGYTLTMTMDEGVVSSDDSPFKLKRIYVSGADHSEPFLKKFEKYME